MAAEMMMDGIIVPRGTDFAFNYVAADSNRFRDWTRVSNVPQGEWASLPQWERNVITSRLRFLIRNNEYCAALAGAFATHMGNSTLRSKSPDKAYNDSKERLWLTWSGSCEVSGLSLAEVEDIIWTEFLCAGELFFLKLASGHVQCIPAEWIFSGTEAPDNEIQGIQYNGTGVPTGYRIGTRDRHGSLVAGKTVIPEAQVIHLYKRDRAEQLRGVPWLSAAAPAIQDIGEITAAKVMSVKAQSHLSAAIIKQGGASSFPQLGDTGNTTGTTKETGLPSKYTTLKSGALLYLEPGEDIKTISTAYQSADFEAFLLSRLRAVSATVGMPIELWLEGYRDSNYSSSRATNLAWGRKVRKTRALVEARFLQPVQLWASERARAKKQLKGDRANDGECAFGWPAIPSIDEQKETTANVEKLKNALTTYSAVYAEANLYWQDEFDQRGREAKYAAEVATREGVPVSAIIPASGTDASGIASRAPDPGIPADMPAPETAMLPPETIDKNGNSTAA
ncbi:MAG: phage portal protein [Opitutaceae bacterium]|nr:phage portal protein [Opitutaceae bacterium]